MSTLAWICRDGSRGCSRLAESAGLATAAGRLAELVQEEIIELARLSELASQRIVDQRNFGSDSMALTESTMLELGTTAPEFSLPDVVTGKTVRRDDFRGQKGLLVMFICTHCPYVKHVEKGLALLGVDLAGEPIKIVAISSNDAESFPEDGPSGLKQQAQKLGFRFPYLFDESQDVARAYKAACTPDFF